MNNSFSFIQWKNKGTYLRGSVQLPRQKNNPWVIFAHGFTGHRIGPGYLYVKLNRELAKYGVSSLRFDFGGCGESEGLFSDMTLHSMAEDLLSAVRLVRRRYVPSQVILLGHSLGGAIAAHCAREAQADGLILLAPVADPQGLAKRRQQAIAHGVNSNGFFENDHHEIGKGFIDSLFSIHPVADFASGFRGNLLLFQGDADPSISIKESGRYIHEAGKCGIDYQYFILKGADHNFSTVSSVQSILGATTDWIKEHYR